MTASSRVQLRAMLAVLFVLILLAQFILVPAVGRDLAVSFPEFASLRTPYTAVVVSGLACGQLALVTAWCLLTLAVRGAAPSRLLAWAAVMTGAAATATLLAVLLAWHLFFAVGQGNPATLAAFGFFICSGTAMTLTAFAVRRRIGGPGHPGPRSAPATVRTAPGSGSGVRRFPD